ncbi:esterase OVCA2-like isoform X2 [Tubulanus polymorphus]|uniref:esterase OVCA2-like isoform X2 n=1 Tax=Tubulanus polymorphus TaxID=672921 RepID=UPI003DA36048
MSSSEKLKILCLHGYRQNEQTFREKTGAFRKIIKSHAELVYITAPNVVPSVTSNEQNHEDSATVNDQRGWWFSTPDDYYRPQDDTDCCKGFDDSLKLIEQTIVEHGPFDGVLGFSQGATMASLVCGLHEQNPESVFKFNFAVFISGFKSHSKPHDQLYSKPVSIPTLHVYGDGDTVIPKEMSEDFLRYFVKPQTLTHPGGHFVPASGAQKKVYQNFFNNMMKNKLDNS